MERRMTDENKLETYESAPMFSKEGKSPPHRNRRAEVQSKNFPWRSIIVGVVILIIMAVVVSEWFEN